MIQLELKVDYLTNSKFWEATGKDEDFKCSLCRKELEEGFICENNREFVLCKECQSNFEMSRCKHNKINEHQHIKFIKRKEENAE